MLMLYSCDTQQNIRPCNFLSNINRRL